MKKLVAVALFFGCAGWVVACGGGQKPPTKDPAVEVQQLMKLFDEARTKFVAQKQSLIKDEDCSRATRLRGAVDKMAEEAAMSTEKNETLTMVQMELQQAETGCLEK